jgi:hypothetical protein
MLTMMMMSLVVAATAEAEAGGLLGGEQLEGVPGKAQ